MREGLEQQIVGVEVLGPLALDALDLGLAQARLYGGEHAHGELVLDGEDVVQRAVVTFRPDVPAGLRLDELAGDTHAVRRFAHAPFEHVAHT
jgi:hypothetical protein